MLAGKACLHSFDKDLVFLLSIKSALEKYTRRYVIYLFIVHLDIYLIFCYNAGMERTRSGCEKCFVSYGGVGRKFGE